MWKHSIALLRSLRARRRHSSHAPGKHPCHLHPSLLQRTANCACDTVHIYASSSRGARPTIIAMLHIRRLRHGPRRATFSRRMLMLTLLLMRLNNDRAQAFLVPSPPTLRVPALFLSLPGYSELGERRATPEASRGAVARRHRVPPLSMSTTSSTTDGGGPHGSRRGDSITREGFLAGTTTIVAAGLAPGVLTKPRGPPSYDVKQERIFDTRKRSFVPAEPERLIVPGLGGKGFSQRIVCLGEMHTHPLHHRMQFNVIKAIHGVTVPRREPLAIGLEMFYRQQQVCLKCDANENDWIV